MSKPIVSFDEQAVKDELRELVRKTIEETINAMLDEEADQLVGAWTYERTDRHTAYRTRHYEQGFAMTSSQITLRMPKLKAMVAISVNEDGYREVIGCAKGFTESASAGAISCRGRNRAGCAAFAYSPTTRRIAKPRFRATPRTAIWRKYPFTS